MKFVVVTIVREDDPVKAFGYKYPAAYNAQEIERAKRGPLVYDGGMTQLDGETEELLIHLQDEVADKLVADKSGACRELTREEADAWLLTAHSVVSQPDEVVNDPNRVALVNTRANAKLALSQDDLEVLDPDHPKAGVTRSKKTVATIFRV